MLINLKPLRAARRAAPPRSSAGCSRSSRDVEGITLYMQPVQDLTIEDRVSRTQYQFTRRESRTPTSSPSGCRSSSSGCAGSPQLADVASDLQDSGLQAYVEIDRATASRLGITPAAIDNALYNAFGQRLVSTIFTQTNQYRVVLEVKPEFQRGPGGARRTSTSRRPCRASRRSRCRCRPIARVVGARRAARDQPHRPVSGGDDLVQPRARRVARRRGEGDRSGARRARRSRRACTINFQGAALAFRASLANKLWLILAAIVTMYIVLGVLYESYIHPITILSTLPSAGVGALLALMLSGNDLGDHRDHRHHPADRHREEERDHDDRLRARRRAQRRHGAARGDLPGVPAALPADPDDDDGGAARRAAADARLAAWAPSCAIRSASRWSAG